MTTLERIWITYLVVVIAIAALADGGGDVGHRPLPFVGIHLALLLLQGAIVALQHGGARRAARALRSVVAVGGCATTFSALCLLLPGVHPEPFEYVWLQIDCRLFGGDVTQPLFASLPPAIVLALQLVYAGFYALPVLGALGCGAVSGAAAFDRASAILVGSFLCSYLGYLLVPTLGPCVVYAAGGEPVEGFAAVVHRVIDRAEANPWDCFPSGHTMLALTSLLVVHRWARPLRPVYAVLAPALIASTILLRYHWPIDVVAGALLSWPVARGIDLLLDRDGMPAPIR